ncbi:MAG TPA: hypothetical protein VJN90_10135 [Candidatus Acidoferrales bacterium]|nr:hypothetical protein [Candidatus Acidoferrales bacterium]
MRRIQLFEIHDQRWFPTFLRDHVTDALQIILTFGHLYKSITHRLEKALGNARTRRVVDLCSGAGGPWLSLCRTIEQETGEPIDVCLTDKYPNAAAFIRANSTSRSSIRFLTDPVDAMRIPSKLSGFRTLFTAFHHFRPDDARAILQNAVDSRQGIGVFEAPGRRALTISLVFLMPITYLVVLPFVRPFQWSRMIASYLIPVIPFVLWFDGIVSCLRTYSLRELRELTAKLGDGTYHWEIGEENGSSLPVSVTYLIGCPENAVAMPVAK